MNEAMPVKGKIGVLIEEHFDDTEFHAFNRRFPERGYAVEYLSHLWGRESLCFRGHESPHASQVEVRKEVKVTDPAEYRGIVLIGAMAMDRLRYEVSPRPGEPCNAPAVAFLRRAAGLPGLKIGAICHSLWLYTAAPELLAGKRVTCAHNIVHDVANAGGVVMFKPGGGTEDLWVDGALITARHPEVIDAFIDLFIAQIERDEGRTQKEMRHREDQS
jgi:protease I